MAANSDLSDRTINISYSGPHNPRYGDSAQLNFELGLLTAFFVSVAGKVNVCLIRPHSILDGLAVRICFSLEIFEWRDSPGPDFQLDEVIMEMGRPNGRLSFMNFDEMATFVWRFADYHVALASDPHSYVIGAATMRESNGILEETDDCGFYTAPPPKWRRKKKAPQRLDDATADLDAVKRNEQF